MIYFGKKSGQRFLLYRKLNNMPMDRVKQQDSMPQNDSTLGFKWIKNCTKCYIV